MTTPEALSDRARHIEGLPGLDQLRGPNSTLQLVGLIENFLRNATTAAAEEKSMSKLDSIAYMAQNAFNFYITFPIRNLQEWSKSVDREIVNAAVSTQPTNRHSLEQMVRDMIGEGVISDHLNLFHEEFGQHHLILFVSPSENWHLIKALFDIDTSSLDGPNFRVSLSHPYLKGIYPRINNGVAPWPTSVSVTDVHDIMLQLIDDAVKERGHKLEDITTPQNMFWGDGKVHLAPTIIDGISAIIYTNSYGVAETGEFSCKGYPNIPALTLRLNPSFLASVRPLAEGEYLRYVPKEAQEHWERIRQEREQRGADDQHAEEPKESKRTEAFNPRDPQGYYKTLGVNPDTDPEDLNEVILAAYRRLAQKYHADTGGDTASHQKMVEINLAYEFLSKDDNRKNYGRHN